MDGADLAALAGAPLEGLVPALDGHAEEETRVAHELAVVHDVVVPFVRVGVIDYDSGLQVEAVEQSNVTLGRLGDTSDRAIVEARDGVEAEERVLIGVMAGVLHHEEVVIGVIAQVEVEGVFVDSRGEECR